MNMMNVLENTATIADQLVGSYRTFGAHGPLYEVQRKVDDEHVHIVVVESGEELDYEVSEALADPEAE